MSTTTHGLTSYDIQPAPFSEDELRQQWNAQADVDEGNHWDNLGLDEQLAWAQTCVIEALRAQGPLATSRRLWQLRTGPDTCGKPSMDGRLLIIATAHGARSLLHKPCRRSPW